MAKDQTPTPTFKRWTETKAFKPFGDPDASARTMTRVVEGPTPPDGATETTDEVRDWNPVPEVA